MAVGTIPFYVLESIQRKIQSGRHSLAVDLARESRMLLVGFLRGESMQVYSGEDRLRSESRRKISPPGA